MTRDDGDICGLIETCARRFKDARALEGDGPNEAPLLFSDLPKLAQRAKVALNDLGVPEGGVVALISPRGPGQAVLFVAISAHFTIAPLSPDLKPDELRDRLAAIRPMAVLMGREGGTVTNALVEQAQKGRAPVFRVDILRAPDLDVGFHALAAPGAAQPPSQGRQLAGGGLILSTSGTTGRPKLVVLEGKKLVHSARNIVDSLGLGEADKSIVVMPLFHIHGLVAGVLAPLMAGASVTVMSNIDPRAFLELAARIGARWYTGVPTLHSAIARAAREAPQVAQACQFRFIRSSSSPLPNKTRDDLEASFNLPVLEAYGMTEASHQISSQSISSPSISSHSGGNQTPRGSVGRPPEGSIRLLDATGATTSTGDAGPTGDAGEIAIRGANVMNGYLDNPRANHETFVDGFMRTGDIGRLTPDGALILVARVKEIIKRGGNQVAPVEVENALLELPGIEEAVVFGVDHATLGEDLAAGVVVTPGHEFCESTARAALFERLSAHKIPSRIVRVDALPVGPTGKLKRIGLQHDLRRELTPRYAAPETGTQRLLCEMVAVVLDTTTPIGINHDFFATGGDSLSAARLISRINAHFSRDLSAEVVFLCPTVQDLAAYVDKRAARSR